MTPTQVVVTLPRGSEARYRRTDGKQVGGEWHQRLRQDTPERRERIRKKEVVDRLSNVQWADRSLAVLERVVATLDAEEAP